MGSITEKINSDMYSEYVEGPINPCKCFFKDLHHIISSERLECLIAYKITHHSIRMMSNFMEICLYIIGITILLLSLGLVLLYTGKPRKLLHRDITIYLYCPIHLKEYTVLLEINVIGKWLRWGFYHSSNVIESIDLNQEKESIPIVISKFHKLEKVYSLFKWNCIDFSETLMNEIKNHPELIRYENFKKTKIRIDIFEGSPKKLLDSY